MNQEEKPLSMAYMRSLIGLTDAEKSLVKDYYAKNGRNVAALKGAIKYSEQLRSLPSMMSPVEVKPEPPETPTLETKSHRSSLHARYSGAYRGLSLENRAKVKEYYESMLKNFPADEAKRVTITYARGILRQQSVLPVETKPLDLVIDVEENTKEKPVVVKSYCRALPGYGVPDDGEEDELVTHLYWLRKDLQVSISLPSNFNTKDVERLTNFLKRLPL